MSKLTVLPPLRDIMIDIESLSTKPNAAVVSLGAVVFDRYCPDVWGDTLLLRFPVQAQLNQGAHAEFSTICRWMTQSASARKRVFGEAALKADQQEMSVVLAELAEFVKRAGPPAEIRLWTNGPAFDSAYLQSMYQRVGAEWPFRYNADRDCRTIFELAYPDGKVPLGDHGVKHDPLDDAIWQARALQMCFRKLAKKWRENTSRALPSAVEASA